MCMSSPRRYGARCIVCSATTHSSDPRPWQLNDLGYMLTGIPLLFAIVSVHSSFLVSFLPTNLMHRVAKMLGPFGNGRHLLLGNWFLPIIGSTSLFVRRGQWPGCRLRANVWLRKIILTEVGFDSPGPGWRLVLFP